MDSQVYGSTQQKGKPDSLKLFRAIAVQIYAQKIHLQEAVQKYAIL